MLKISDVEIKRKNVLLKQDTIEFSNNINVIKGKNGTGKTTLLEMIYFGKLKLLINEEVVNEPQNYIAFLSQYDYMLRHLTIDQIIELLDLENGVLNFLETLNISPDKVYKTLSGGEKQKVRIMAAIFDKKGIVILDEPFNNVDEKSIVVIKKYIESMEEKCFIVTNHNAKISFENEKIYVLQDQKLSYEKVEDTNVIYPSFKRDKKLNFLFYKSRFVFIIALLSLLVGSFYMLRAIEFETEQYFYDDNIVIYHDDTEEHSEDIAIDLPTSGNVNLVEYGNVYIQTMQNPKELIEQVIMPVNGSNVEYIEYGEYPKDYSNEILIDNEVAKKLFPELENEEIIGQNVTYNDNEFIISGIYIPMNDDKNIVYQSFKEETTTSNYYLCSEKYNCSKENAIYNDHSFKNNKVTYLFILIVCIITISIFIMLLNVFLQRTKTYRNFIKYNGFKNTSYLFEITTCSLFIITLVIYLIYII